jgi:anti-sigma factor RsiW
MSGGELSCKELVEVITDYLEGTMGVEDRRRFEAHLEVCPFCVTYLEQMRQTTAIVGELQEESIAPSTREELLSAFHGWRSAQA